MRNYYSILLSFFILISCTNKEKENLYKEMIEVHDEVMPKIEEISLLKSKLKQKVEQVSKGAIISKDSLNSITKSILALEKAEQSMMTWMHEFNPSYDTLSHDIAVNYLREEKLKIEQVKKETLEAIDAAKKKL